MAGGTVKANHPLLAILVAYKLLNMLVGGSLFVKAIQLYGETENVTGDGLTTTYVAIALQVTSFVLNIVGYFLLDHKESQITTIVIMVEFLVFLATTILASIQTTEAHFHLSLLNLTLPAVVLISPGALMLIFNAIGWFGMVGKKFWLVILSGVLTLLQMVAEIGILAFAYKSSALQTFESPLKGLMKHYYSAPGCKGVLDYIHRNLDCCGVNGPMDWLSDGFAQIPPSCFGSNGLNYTQGCVTEISAWLTGNKFYIGACFALIVSVQIGVGILSIWHGCRSR